MIESVTPQGNQTLAYYLGLDWTYTIETFNKGSQKVYIVHVNELEGIFAAEHSVEEAMQQARLLMADALGTMLKRGQVIPEPIKRADYKGNIAYRTSQERHYEIAKQAKRCGLSLSKYVDRCVDSYSNRRDER